ncbi:MAG: Fic family protein [Spirochaetaceae bacterium]|nr:MAG: Fic family protein [Spirochaetaceae bacterium]
MSTHVAPFQPSVPYDALPPLPPPAHVTDSVPVLRREADARQALAELKGMANIIPNQAILINAIALREAKDSSEIENIVTTQERLYRALAAGSSAAADASTKEVMQYRSALRIGEALIREHGFLSVNHIIKIQTEIVGNDAGLRATPGTALVDDRTGEVVYTPPHNPAVIRQLLSNFADFYNGAATSLADMAILHYQFETIHPFLDGNGRTGRILNVLYLILKGFLDIPILYPSSYIIAHKHDYYRYLRGVTASGEWEQWILFMLDAIVATSVDTIERVREIRAELDRTVDEVRAALPRIYTRKLVETLFVHPYSKIEFLVDAVGVERKAASRYLQALEELGLLESQQVGREKLYINVRLMKILSSE